jgi:hypothetical protein
VVTWIGLRNLGYGVGPVREREPALELVHFQEVVGKGIRQLRDGMLARIAQGKEVLPRL